MWRHIPERRVFWLGLGAALLAGPVLAEEGVFTLNGDVKSFYTGMFPYDHLIMPDDPLGQAAVDQRLKLVMEFSPQVGVTIHHATTSSIQSGQLDIGFMGTGSGTTVPEAIDLSWAGDEDKWGEGFTLQGRFDRMLLAISIPHVNITAGRQAISFGTGFFFTPMDLVAPFSPTVVDREYKTGFDALRVEVFSGTSGKIEAVAAYGGSWDRDGLILAAHGGWTIGTTDMGVFLGSVHGDGVFGVDTAGSLGVWSLRGEATGTLPASDDEDPFLRAMVGVDRYFADFTVMGEIYVQTNGASDSSEYLARFTSERVQRGELWAVGQYYAAISTSWQVTPLIGFSAFAMANLADPSVLVGPGLSWSVANNADLAIGAYTALGERPGEVDLLDLMGATTEEEMYALIPVESEFGIYPSMGYMQLKAYF